MSLQSKGGKRKGRFLADLVEVRGRSELISDIYAIYGDIPWELKGDKFILRFDQTRSEALFSITPLSIEIPKELDPRGDYFQTVKVISGEESVIFFNVSVPAGELMEFLNDLKGNILKFLRY